MNARRQWMLLIAAWLVLAQAAWPQSTFAGDTLIASRQGEVAALAHNLYRLNMQQPGWGYERVEVCPEFTHHRFALYRHRNSRQVTASFVAIYLTTSTTAAASNSPWTGGILLLPHDGIPTRETAVFADRASSRAIFNRVWSEERLAGHGPLDRGVLAACYARFSGEVPLSPEVDSTAAIAPSVQPDVPVTNVQVPLVDQAGGSRWLYLEFDKDGMITESKVGSVVAKHSH